ncbi:MAG: aryl-sulfate sulfotransferase, partial [Candidatus Thiodiazotropha sp.]
MKPCKVNINVLCIFYLLTLFIAGCGGGSSSSSEEEGDIVVEEQAASLEGYNLFSSLDSTTTYLMDNGGSTIHSWVSDYRPGNGIYLLENGELLHTGNVGNSRFNAGGAGGVVQTLDWDSEVTWEYSYSSSSYLQHHDVEMLPNGNLLMIAWQVKSEAEALAAGRDPSLLNDGELWPDSVIEVRPTGANSGEIVWQWQSWDHLVQDYDPSKPNYGVVADHPELIDLNHAMNGSADWHHINAIDYNAELDQILLTVHNFSEIWIIDHSTTTTEAAGYTGGNSGRGGDLLYRWGNPQAYGAGGSDDQQLFVPHDAEWIEAGYPGEGNILIFNNGGGRSDGNYSSIEEITPPLEADGNYNHVAGAAFGPDDAVWNYTAETPSDFYA